MLCFLPPVVALPGYPRPSPPRHATTAAALLLGSVAVMELVTPVGWTHTQHAYSMRVGEASRLGPGTLERDVIPRLSRPTTASGGSSGRLRFFASRAAYTAVPPGLEVDAATGALVGIPLMAGSYTVAVGVSDGTSHSMTGPTFRVKVLPAL